MKKKLVVVLLFSIFINRFSLAFSKKQYIQDFKYLEKKIKENQMNLYDYTTEKKIQILENIYFSNLKYVKNVREFYSQLAYYVSSFGMNHTFLVPSRKINSDYMKCQLLFPLKIVIEKNACFVKYHGELYNLLNINRIPINTILGRLIALNFGRNILRKNAQIEARFSYFYYLSFGPTKYYVLTLMSNQNKLIKIRLKGKANKPNKQKKQQYFFKVLEKNIGYIKLQSFSFKFKPFKKFLDSKMVDLKKIKNLIIDLRNNTGGNFPLIGNFLIQTIYSGSYKEGSQCKIRLSPDVYNHILKFHIQYGLAKSKVYKLKKKINSIIILKEKKEKKFRTKAIFKGKIYILINRRTYSAAIIFATIFKDYHIGKIIGEEGGENPTSLMDNIRFVLPNTKIQLAVSYLLAIRPNGKNTHHGLLPDYYSNRLGENALKIALDIINKGSLSPLRQNPY